MSALHQMTQALRRVRRFDARRPSVPGEHWATLGAGLTLLSWAGQRRSPLLRMLASAAALALLVRAVTGRDGLLQRLRQQPR